MVLINWNTDLVMPGNGLTTRNTHSVFNLCVRNGYPLCDLWYEFLTVFDVLFKYPLERFAPGSYELAVAFGSMRLLVLLALGVWWGLRYSALPSGGRRVITGALRHIARHSAHLAPRPTTGYAVPFYRWLAAGVCHRRISEYGPSW